MSEYNRRDALRLMTAAGIVGTSGCRDVASQPPDATQSSSPTKSANSASPSAATVVPLEIKVTPLPSSGPWPTDDPFLFCVHHQDAYPAGNPNLGPKASLAGRNLGQDFSHQQGWSMYHGTTVPGFPRHPHRGFETVTVVQEGLIDHADSLGAAARYGDGDVQWLTAGDGIVHAEMFPLLNANGGNTRDFFQIWINLPAIHKRVSPHFTMFWANQIPTVTSTDHEHRSTQVKVVAGSYQNHDAPKPPPNSWASQDQSDVAIWTISLSSKAQWTLPATTTGVRRSLYITGGSGLRIGEQEIASGHRIEVNGHQAMMLEDLGEGTEVLLLQARPIGEPIVKYGPFVMNTEAEIQEAYADYRRTRFGTWPFDR